MNFSVKKVFSITAILLIIGGTSYYVYNLYYQKSSEETPVAFDTSPAAVKDKCLKDLEDASDEELMNEIKNIKNAEETDPTSGEKRITIAEKKIASYFSCKVTLEKDEAYYNKAKSFISELDIQEDNKQASLSKLEEVFLKPSPKNFLIELALGDIGEICPSQIELRCQERVKLTRDRNREINENERETLESDCNNLCSSLDKYLNNKDNFKEEILDNNGWGSTRDVRRGQFRFKASIAYRVKGKEAALEICSKLEDEEEKKECLADVGFIEKVKTDKLCASLRDELKKISCSG